MVAVPISKKVDFCVNTLEFAIEPFMADLGSNADSEAESHADEMAGFCVNTLEFAMEPSMADSGSNADSEAYSHADEVDGEGGMGGNVVNAAEGGMGGDVVSAAQGGMGGDVVNAAEAKKENFIYKLGQATGMTRGKILPTTPSLFLNMNKLKGDSFLEFMMVQWESQSGNFPFALNGDCGSIYYKGCYEGGTFQGYEPVAVHTSSGVYCNMKVSIGIPLTRVEFKGYDCLFSPSNDDVDCVKEAPFFHHPGNVDKFDKSLEDYSNFEFEEGI